ncbi:MAG TPA: EamA family transporter [Streptosporangiaceae bacterium]|nr:EamA family transporter [Streptosporangiaceae bacterium]
MPQSGQAAVRPASPASPPSRGAGRDPLGRVPPPLLIGTGILTVQVGAGLAARMFGTVTAAGLTGVRLWAAALLLAALGARPTIRAVRGVIAERAWRDAVVVLAFGVTLGVMNFSIYQAFARIPLGIAVTIEFLGPLAVAIASSRRLIDVLWVLLAGTGVTLLGTAGVSVAKLGDGAASHASHFSTELTGVLFALAAAASWACYILLATATGRRFSGSAGLVIAMVLGAIVITPVAVISAGGELVKPSVLGAGLAIALLSSVIPYRFEIEALRRVSARVFGIWMSLEPAVGALAGLVLLSQALSVPQWIAISCVVVASAGAALGENKAAAAPQA